MKMDNCCYSCGAVTVTRQLLLQEKNWPGFGYSDLGPGFGSGRQGPSSGISPMWDPGVDPLPANDYRREFRKRYQTVSVTWVNDPGSYTASMSVDTGPGFVCTSSGFPGGSGYQLYDMSDPAGRGVPNVTSYAQAWSSYHEEGYYGADPTMHHYSLDVSLGTDIPFATHLAIATDRLAARSFPGSFTDDVIREGFDEDFAGDVPGTPDHTVGGGGAYLYGSGLGQISANYSGAPKPIGRGAAGFAGPPYYNAASGFDALASYWVYSTGEADAVYFNFQNDTGLSGVYAAANIQAGRCRFKTDVPVRYFLVKARIVNWNFNNYPITNGLEDATVIESGILAAGTIKEITFPDDTDFVETDETGTLSCGQIVFAVLNETQAAWSTRTGITL